MNYLNRDNFNRAYESSNSNRVNNDKNDFIYTYNQKTNQIEIKRRIKRVEREASKVIDDILDMYNDSMVLYKMFGDLEYKQRAEIFINMLKN